MTKFSTMTGLIALAAVGAAPVLAQTVPDSEVPTTSLNIPGNVQLYGDATPNVYRPSATVNGEIGRAPCRERVCQYVLIWVVAVYSKKKIKGKKSDTKTN